MVSPANRNRETGSPKFIDFRASNNKDQEEDQNQGHGRYKTLDNWFNEQDGESEFPVFNR